MFRGCSFIVVAVCVAVVAGCRVDPYAEVREREWRRLEEEIYHRESIIAELEAELDSCRRENDALRRRGGVSSEPRELLPTPPRGADDEVPPEDIRDFQPPKTELGEEGPPPLGRARPPRRLLPLVPAKHEALAAPANTEVSSSPNVVPTTDGVATPLDATCGPAVSLAINRRLTGGDNTDGCFGDEGIMAVVEARDAAGKLVGDPGAMTLALYDPRASGDRSVVAQWDFSAAETAARFREGAFGSGVHFELPWPNRPPRRSTLRLEVRLTTTEGKTLSATHKFSVDLIDATAADEAKTPWRPTRE